MGVLFALLTASSYSLSNIFIRKGMGTSKADNGLLMTVIVNVIILGIAAILYRIFTTNVPITLYAVSVFAISGALTTFLGRIALFKSFREIGPIRGSAIKSSAPLFTIIFAVIFLQEVIRMLPFIGILFVLVGLGIQGYYLLRQSSIDVNKKDVNLKHGYFLALFSAIVFGVGQAIRKPGMEALPDPVFGAFIGSGAALAMILLSEWKKGVLKETVTNQITSFNLYYLFSGLLTSVAMLSFFIAMLYMQVSYVVAIAASEPLITILLSKIILKKQESIAYHSIFSAFVVFSGVLIIILFT